jgi:siroheme synthase
MNFYYITLSIFAVAAYFILTDEGVAAAFFYVTKLAKAYIEQQWWWLTHNPRNPVVKYMMWRRSEKLAQELMDEFKNK